MIDPLTFRILEMAIAIQQIPAPTGSEAARAEFLQHQFTKEGLKNVHMDAAGNVLACIPGSNSSAKGSVVISAHLDTVFPAGTDLRIFREPERICGAGILDNAIGVAALLGLAWILRSRSIHLPGDVWLAGTVGEEGLGDLRGMRTLVERFGSEPRAYIILEGASIGAVYHRALGVCRYRISMHTAGGHSWIDYGRPSAVHELTRLAARLTSLQVPKEPRTTLNVGTISGGTSVNTIAAEASLDLDLRSEDATILADLRKQVEALVESARREGVDTRAEVTSLRPAGEIPAVHPFVRLVQDCMRAEGIDPALHIGSTDANIPLSRGLPAVTIGLTTGHGAHTVREYINIEPLHRGMNVLIELVCQCWEPGALSIPSIR